MTKLKGPRRGVHYDLFAMLDIYSRYCPGWMVVDQEDGQVAKAWLKEVTASQQIAPGTLTIHADRGSSMTSKPVAVLLSDLKIGRTHSRPQVSNDCIQKPASRRSSTARPSPSASDRDKTPSRSARRSSSNHNHHHRHSGIGLHTPASVHFGTVEEIRETRAHVLDTAYAYAARPERFVNKPPTPPLLPGAAWINKPVAEEVAQSE